MNIIPISTYFERESVEQDREYIYLFTDNAGRTSGKIPIQEGWYKNKYGEKKNIEISNNDSSCY